MNFPRAEFGLINCKAEKLHFHKVPVFGEF